MGLAPKTMFFARMLSGSVTLLSSLGSRSELGVSLTGHRQGNQSEGLGRGEPLGGTEPSPHSRHRATFSLRWSCLGSMNVQRWGEGEGEEPSFPPSMRPVLDFPSL